MDRDLCIIIRHLYIPVVLIDIHPHTIFQVATITGTLKSTSYKNLTLILTGSHTYVRTGVRTDVRT